MPENIQQYQHELNLPPEERSNQWYLSRFEERLQRLNSYTDYTYMMPLETSLDHAVGLRPKKLTSMVIYRPKPDRFEILIPDNRESGYQQKDHSLITDQYGVVYSNSETRNGVIFEANGNRYILANVNILLGKFINDEDCGGTTALMDMYKRYNITKSWSVLDRNYTVNPSDDFSFTRDKLLNFYDDLVFDGWTSQLAIQNQWTNFDWMRFRLVKEWPEREK